MRRTRYASGLTAAAVVLLLAGSIARAADGPVKVLIITGDNIAAHDWQGTTEAFLKILGDSSRFRVDVTKTPAKDLTDENLARYDVLLLNYFPTAQGGEDTKWSDSNKAAFIKAVKEGGKGVYVHHFASAAFANPNWKEFEQAIAGGWRTQGFHGPAHEFKVKKTAVKHPASANAPAEFDHIVDELYSGSLRTKGSLTLATAYCDPEKPAGTGMDEAVIWVNTFGKGRVFNNALGHNANAMSDKNFQEWARNGLTWAGGGK